ncbi:O-antigen/teichoic acid export membrane protein [Thermococcus stetteri]|nr:O-antigen/teichoic acid export membrane protein [Thermococcus stetteri]
MIPVFLSSASVIYTPIVTSLYVQGKIKEMGRVYQILTKWIFLLTLPIFAVLFLFSETTVSFVFGEKYIPASSALQILSIGFMFHTFLGLNGLTLIIIGKPTLNMVGDTLAVISNISLNFALIPRYGMVGAAIATAVSYIIANIFRSYWPYKRIRIHPFSWNYVKILIIDFGLLGVLKLVAMGIESIWHAVFITTAFLIIDIILTLLSRSIDKEDIELVVAIEKRTGVSLGKIREALERFV